jgi:hypothetical protein
MLAASRAASGSAALGGPETTSTDIGPFQSRAEAERMRHEMRDPGAIVIEGGRKASQKVYFVRLGS